MTTPINVQVTVADTIVICGGGARPEDEHLLSIVHCVDEEIIEWLARREKEEFETKGITS
jgi:hypothetical protein